MSGILSEEANKIQAELDHASLVVTAWQQRSAGMCATIVHLLQSKEG